MATFRFYATLDDELAVLREILSANDWKVIPIRRDLSAPVLASYGEITAKLEHELAAHSLVELEGAFTIHPMAFVQNDDGKTYFLDSRVGPRLSWYRGPAPVGRRGKPELVPSELGHLASYRDPSGAREGPSDALEVAYSTVVKAIKKHAAKTKIRGKEVWISRDAKLRFDAGELIIDP